MENSTLMQELKKAGLTDKEAAVYATVLDMGSAFPSKIAAASKLNRSTVYKILDDLVLKGLVSELERNKKLCYQVERPNKLVHYARNKIQRAEDSYEYAKKLLPEIEGLFSLVPNKPKVRFFEGIDGIKTVFSDHVAEEKKYEMVAYSNVEDLIKVLPPQFVAHYVKSKALLGVTTRAIFPETPFATAYNRRVYSKVDKKTHINMRFTPAETFPYKGEITMYGRNKVSIVNFHEKILIGVIIEDETISNMMRMIFELAWKGVANYVPH